MKRHLMILTTALTIAGTTAPAFASSMPKADFGGRNTFGFGIGDGASVSLDFPLSSQFSLGGALSLRRFTTNTLDFRGLVKLVPGGSNRLTLDLLGGVQVYGPSFGNFNSFDPFLGVALAYPFTSRLTGRLNIAAAFATSSSFALDATRASGLELAYEFTPTLEGTLGYNGRGDVLGLKLSF